MIERASIIASVPDEAVVSVDGAFGAAGLNLSHWPGNKTPENLRHELSCGIALNFARLPAQERERLVGSATRLVNNHFDTDGCCAAFAVLHGELALELEERLLAIARCGDFYCALDDGAFAADTIVMNMADPLRSPIAAEIAGLSDCARYTRAQEEILRILPALCRGELEPYSALFEPELKHLHADRALLARAARSDDSDCDLTVWQARAASGQGTQLRLPGRHALFSETTSDRALVLLSTRTGTLARLVLSTRSWFDLPGRASRARPNLLALAERLQARCGSQPFTPAVWHAQEPDNASPELWFGREGQARFQEHNERARPAPLSPAEILAQVRAVLAPGSVDQ